MAFAAIDIRMRRDLMGNDLRLHHCMAGRTEFGGFCIVDGFKRKDKEDKQKENNAACT